MHPISHPGGASLENHREEEALLARLGRGEEAAFAALVDQLQGRLYAFARTFTTSPALAEDIVQETWLAVIRGLGGFEGRSSLRTWIFGILVRRAKTVASREARRPEVPYPGANGHGENSGEEWDLGYGRRGLWERAPAPWGLEDPAAVFQTKEALEIIDQAVREMPETQRQVVLLRDVEGLESADACNILGLSETNQRVLLHRGRARVRRALDRYLQGQTDLAGPLTGSARTRGERS
jgi:RNA polymerase sigma-70 factor (ECF subfamily)